MRKSRQIVLSMVLGAIAGIGIEKATRKKKQLAKIKGKHVPFGPYEAFFKRPLDILLAGSALILLSPIMGITAFLVKVNLGSPVLFKQERTGVQGKSFFLYKFRSMSNEMDSAGQLLSDEILLGSFGKKLRATSIDELPSLWNVIRGDISLIGPRPLPTRYLKWYTKKEQKRHEIRPGITGLAQINGRNYVSWEDKFHMDVQYTNHISMKLDIYIIFKTLFVVLKHSNIDTGSYLKHDDIVYKPLDVERIEKLKSS